MKDNNMYEMTLDSTQLNILERALSAFISEAYSGIEDEVVDVENTYEEIKVAFDIQQVIRYEKGGDGSPKQTSKDTSLVWIKKAFGKVEDECTELTKEQIVWLSSRTNNCLLNKETFAESRQRYLNNKRESKFRDFKLKNI